jgi:iron complex transport system substrate-binding protein
MHLTQRIGAIAALLMLTACSGQPAVPTQPDATTEPVATVAATEAAPVSPTTTAAATAGASETTAVSATTAEEPAPPSIAADLPAVEPDLSAFPVTIENCGRSLTFEQPPERVVSLWQPPNEILLALGLKDRIVALAGNYTTLPSDLAAEAEGIPEIGTSMAWPSKEVLLSQQPDLVISEVLDGFAFDGAQGYATVAEIEATGAKVISTGSRCTQEEGADRTIDAVYDDLRTLGTVFGVSEHAEALISKLRERENAVTSRVAGRPPVKVAFYNGGEGPLFVLAGGVWSDAITKAGGTNVFSPDVDFQVSVEAFAAAQPDVILVGYFPGQEPEALIEFLKQTFPNVPAVQNNRLTPVATIETEAGVRVMDGLETIARALHPEAFR